MLLTDVQTQCRQSSQLPILNITTPVTQINTLMTVQVTDKLTAQSIPQQVIQKRVSGPSLHLAKAKATALHKQYWSYTKSLMPCANSTRILYQLTKKIKSPDSMKIGEKEGLMQNTGTNNHHSCNPGNPPPELQPNT